MKRHIRPLSVRRASADRDALLRQEHDAALRAEADMLLGARGYTLTGCDFSPARGTYTIDFHATDDPDSRYVARDQDTRLLTIRTYPVRIPLNARAPAGSRFANSFLVTLAFAAAARTGFEALGDFAAPPLV